jgi:tetratricopeptide (TPR) repeat protein
MPRPRKRFPFDSKYDFSYQPESYWPETPTEATTLAKVKGTARRDLARRALAEGKDAPRGEIDVEFAFAESLDEDERRAWGGIHPALMGGEYLPGPEEGEVEIARVELESMTGDVIQVLARPSGPKAKRRLIRYRIVDEYMDMGSKYEVKPKSSLRPLTFAQIINLIDMSQQIGALSYGARKYELGLADSHREYSYREGSGDALSLRDFVSVSSAFYPQLAAYYDDRAEHWYRPFVLEALENELEGRLAKPSVWIERPISPAKYKPNTLLFILKRSPWGTKDRVVNREAVESWMRYKAGLDGFELQRSDEHAWLEGKKRPIVARWLQGRRKRVAKLENRASALLPIAKESPLGAELLERDLGDRAVSVEQRLTLALAMDMRAKAAELVHELGMRKPFAAAEYLEWLGRSDEAIVLYRKVVSRRPVDVAWAMLRAGLIEEAEQLFGRARAREKIDSILGLAAVAKQRDDLEAALSLYEEWIRAEAAR